MSESLGQFLEAIKRTQQASYNYVGAPENGVTPFGAYGMLRENWQSWSAAAGVGDVDMFDPAAQDRVAGYWGQKLFQRYGSWDMVAAAWFVGRQETDRAMQAGANGTGWFKNKETRKFLDSFTANFKDSIDTPLPPSARKFATPGSAPKGWLNPIAGQSEYSNSFRVPRDNKWGIHGAIDVYSQRGTPIVAPVGGVVRSAATDKGKGGNWVQIQGDDGLTYYFAHMDGAPAVKSGQRITAGTQLGAVGNSGSASGTKTHLHFAVKQNGRPLNPYSYLQGARNSENNFTPEQAAFTLDGQRSPSSKLDAVLESVSSQVAGGQRVDYRTLGEPEVGSQAAMETDTASAQKDQVPL